MRCIPSAAASFVAGFGCSFAASCAVARPIALARAIPATTARTQSTRNILPPSFIVPPSWLSSFFLRFSFEAARLLVWRLGIELSVFVRQPDFLRSSSDGLLRRRRSWSISFVTSRTNVDFSSAVKSRPGLPRFLVVVRKNAHGFLHLGRSRAQTGSESSTRACRPTASRVPRTRSGVEFRMDSPFVRPQVAQVWRVEFLGGDVLTHRSDGEVLRGRFHG